jgi:hypothetical protein
MKIYGGGGVNQHILPNIYARYESASTPLAFPEEGVPGVHCKLRRSDKSLGSVCPIMF